MQTNLKARCQCSLAAAERSASRTVACGTTRVVGTALDFVVKVTLPPPAGLPRPREENLEDIDIEEAPLAITRVVTLLLAGRSDRRSPNPEPEQDKPEDQGLFTAQGLFGELLGRPRAEYSPM